MRQRLYAKRPTVEQACQLNQWHVIRWWPAQKKEERRTPRKVSQGDRCTRALWLSVKGHTVDDIAEDVGLDKRTVRKWIKHYNQYGLVGLASIRAGRGRPVQITRRQIEIILAVAHTDPWVVVASEPFATWGWTQLTDYVNGIMEEDRYVNAHAPSRRWNEGWKLDFLARMIQEWNGVKISKTRIYAILGSPRETWHGWQR